MTRQTRNAAFASLCLLALGAMACTFSLFQIPTLPPISTTAPKPAIPTPTLLPKAQTIFMASIPEPLQSGESLALASWTKSPAWPSIPSYIP